MAIVLKGTSLGMNVKKKAIIIGGGAAALALSAELAKNKVHHYIVYPSQDSSAPPFSSQVGESRNFSTLTGYHPKMLEEMAKHYPKTDIETENVRLTYIFQNPEQGKEMEKKHASNANVSTTTIDDLPINRTSMYYEGELYGDIGESNSRIHVLEDNAAFNIKMSSYNKVLKAEAAEYVTHIEGTTNELQNDHIVLENGDTLFGDAIFCAAGPYNGELLEKNKKNLLDYPVELYKECTQIYPAPTAKYKLPQGHPFRKVPRNFYITGESELPYHYFGITEGEYFRISAFDKAPSDEIDAILKKEYDRTFGKDDKQFIEKSEAKKEDIDRYIEGLNKHQFSEQNRKRIRARFSINTMKGFPEELTEFDKFRLDDIADFLNIDTKAEYYTNAPWVASKIGVPLVGRIPSKEKTPEPGKGLFVIGGYDGSGYKHMIGPDQYSSLAGILYQKAFMDGVTPDHLRMQKNREASGNFYLATEPKNHFRALAKQKGKPLYDGQEMHKPVVTMYSGKKKG